MINEAQFRADLPEFADTAKFTSSMVNYWIANAALMLRVERWGQSAASPWPVAAQPAAFLAMYDMGAEQFVAHNLALEARDMAAAAGGGIPGASGGGVQQSKSVDKVSVSYDTQSSAELNAGHWNLTIYGKRFIRLARMFGAGAIQLGVGVAPPYTGQAWPGPSYPYENQ